MLRACAIDCGKNWDKHLSLAEFAYNNSYQSSLKMAPFEALYGRRCRTPLNWSQPGERENFGPDLVTEAKRKVKLIRKNLEAHYRKHINFRGPKTHENKRKPTKKGYFLRHADENSRRKYIRQKCATIFVGTDVNDLFSSASPRPTKIDGRLNICVGLSGRRK